MCLTESSIPLHTNANFLRPPQIGRTHTRGTPDRGFHSCIALTESRERSVRTRFILIDRVKLSGYRASGRPGPREGTESNWHKMKTPKKNDRPNKQYQSKVKTNRPIPPIEPSNQRPNLSPMRKITSRPCIKARERRQIRNSNIIVPPKVPRTKKPLCKYNFVIVTSRQIYIIYNTKRSPAKNQQQNFRTGSFKVEKKILPNYLHVHCITDGWSTYSTNLRSQYAIPLALLPKPSANTMSNKRKGSAAIKKPRNNPVSPKKGKKATTLEEIRIEAEQIIRSESENLPHSSPLP